MTPNEPAQPEWDRPNGNCSSCGAPLNAAMIGGYRLHDGEGIFPSAGNLIAVAPDLFLAAVKAEELLRLGNGGLLADGPTHHALIVAIAKARGQRPQGETP